MIYINRQNKISQPNSVAMVTADSVIELDAYLQLVCGYSNGMRFPVPGSPVVIAQAAHRHLRGDREVLVERDFILRAARLGANLHLEHTRLLDTPGVSEHYVRWAMGQGVEVPVKYLPKIRPTKAGIDEQVKQSLVEHIRDGFEHGESVNVVYLSGCEHTSTIGTINRLLRELVKEGRVIKGGDPIRGGESFWLPQKRP